jgi:hypothetical protein
MAVSPILTATVDSVAGAATSTQLFASSTSAKGRSVANDSAAALYLKYGTAATTSSFTVEIAAGGYFEFPVPLYGGVVEGIWGSATGAARVTEW